MKIAVVGHLCFDVIHLPEGNAGSGQNRTYGGIFFALGTLANLLGEEATVVPIFGVGKKDHPQLRERLAIYRNVDTSALFTFGEPTNEVHLYYHDEQRRTECSKHISEPVPWKLIKPHLDADMILVNMVSGFDVTLETLDQLRMEVRNRHVPVYLDVHSLSLGVGENHTRFRRPLEEWRRWLFWLHAVQMNEEELGGLTSEKLKEEDFAKQLTSLNTPVVVVTRASRGCTVYVDQRKQMTRHDFPGAGDARSADPTGCGDIFGAAYCAKYLETRDSLQSAGFANTVATHKALYGGPSWIDQLARFRIERSLQPGVVS